MATKSALEQRWLEELRRIKRTVATYEKKGYSFENFKMPTVPKKITEKSLARITAITTEKILSSGKKPSPIKFSSDNELIREWKEEVKRIKRTVSRYMKKGYTFERFSLPRMPKTISDKSLQRVKALTTQKILSKANVRVGNRTLHLPTAQKIGAVRTRFNFETKSLSIESRSRFPDETGESNERQTHDEPGINMHEVSEREREQTIDPTWGFDGLEIEPLEHSVEEQLENEDKEEVLFPKGVNKDYLDTDEPEYKAEDQQEDEDKSEFYTDEEFSDIKKKLGFPDDYDVPDERERAIETFEEDLNFADTFGDNYIDEALADWDSLNMYYITGHGVVYHLNTPDLAQEKAQDAFRLQRLFNEIKNTMDRDELLQRLEQQRDRISELIDIIMYKVYSQDEVTEALEELERILTE